MYQLLRNAINYAIHDDSKVDSLYKQTINFEQIIVMNRVSWFRWIANLEGISFLLLLFIAMPLKYIWQQPWLVQQVGMAHGVLFVGYIIGVFVIRKQLMWTNKQVLLALLLSFVPFGTFYVTGKMMRGKNLVSDIKANKMQSEFDIVEENGSGT